MSKHKIIFITLSSIVLIFILLNFNKAVKGLFWNVNKYQLKLFGDRILCTIASEKCNIDATSLTVNFGIYDFSHTFESNDKIAMQHHFVDWTSNEELESLGSLFLSASEKNRWVLLTIEPYPNDPADNTLTETTTGTHDTQIGTICSHINNSPTPVFVRWGHEMENITGRYPWATEHTKSFVAGYNYFVSKCKSYTDNAFYVWSPAGHYNLADYWPGPANVDYVGASLFIYDEFEYDHYGRIRTFDEAFGERYEYIKVYEKPIIISEIGIHGSETLQKYWWYNASKALYKYALLKTIVYFNGIDTEGVWKGYDTPDWTISGDIYPY
jgi:beta-mannanase